MLAIQSPPESDQRRAAAIMIGAQRAADLVSKMLAYSGGGRVVAEHVDLDALVRRWSICWRRRWRGTAR